MDTIHRFHRIPRTGFGAGLAFAVAWMPFFISVFGFSQVGQAGQAPAPGPVSGHVQDIQLSTSVPGASDLSPVSLQAFASYSRLSVRIDDDVQATFKDKNGKFEILFKGATFLDLGIRLGQDASLRSELVKLTQRDPRISELTIRETSEGLKLQGSWRFPTGNRRLAHPAMERFIYRTREPEGASSYVLDFWVKEGPTVAQAAAIARKNAYEAGIRKATEEAEKRRARRLASVEQARDSEDLNRFCKSPLSPERDFFIPFYPDRQPIDWYRWYPKNYVDSQYSFESPQVPHGGSSHVNERELAHVRLAIKLYQSRKYALALRTLDFMEKEFPKSKFLGEMNFLRAAAYQRLDQVEESIPILLSLIHESPSSEPALQASLYLVARRIEDRNFLGALELFMSLIKHHPDHPLAWTFHLGSAETLVSLRETTRAEKEYEWVAENAHRPESRAEGAFRLGDIFLSRRQYDRALAAYYKALNQFPKQAESFPSIHLNRAESLYHLGELKLAREAFEKFLQEHPSYSGGWRATLRLGEILGRSDNPQERAALEARMMETANRYPYSPGAVLARIRMLPCGQHAGLTFESAERFFSTEAANYRGNDEVFLDDYPDFRSLYRVRTAVSLAPEGKAVEIIGEELRKNPRRVAQDEIVKLHLALFRRSVLDLLNKGEKLKALSFFQDNAEGLPKEANSLDPELFLSLSRAASEIGLPELARKLSERYKKSVEAVAALGQKGRAPAAAADESDLEHRIRKAEVIYTDVLASWISQRSQSETAEEKKLRDSLALIPDESPHSDQREIILSLLEERQGKSATALQHAIRAQALSSEEHRRDPRLLHWIASLSTKAGDIRAANRLYSELQVVKREKESRYESLGLPPVPELATLILAEGETLARRGKWGEAAAAYARAVEKGLGGNQLLFEYARALQKSPKKADQLRAQEVLTQITTSKQDDFWKKLAQEALENRQAKEGVK